MQFSFRPMRWADIATISRWRYDGVYAFYDLHLSPLISIMALQTIMGRVIGEPVYYTTLDERGVIVGMFSYLRNQAETLEVGLALRPDLTGQAAGIGLSFVQAGMDFGRRQFRPKRFRLTVATFNARAIRVYEQAGFTRDKIGFRRKLGKRYEALEMSRLA